MDEPRGDNQQDASEAWSEVTAGFVNLGTRLRTYFEAVPDEDANDEMRTAWGEFTDAAQRLGRSVTSAFQDEEVQDGAKRAFSTLVDAVGQTVRDAGADFQWSRSEDEDSHSQADPASDRTDAERNDAAAEDA